MPGRPDLMVLTSRKRGRYRPVERHCNVSITKESARMSQRPDQRVPTLDLHDVSKAFGPVIALRSGSLTLYPGSIHAVVGENGAGKSTLVKIIAGLYHC